MLFSQPSKKALIRDILNVCGEKHNLQVNDTSFLRLIPPAASGFKETVATLLNDYRDKMSLGNKPAKTSSLFKVFKK